MKKKITTETPSNPLIIAITGSTYGVYGWVKVFPSTENPISIFQYQPWFIKKTNRWNILTLEKWKYHNHDIIIKAQGIDNRDAAVAQLTCCEIIMDSTKLPKLKEGEYYWKDIIGCQVMNLKNNILGEVSSIIETGSNDVLIIKTDQKTEQKSKEQLIPFLYQKVIKNINLPARTIHVDWEIEF
ncbi:ribosome maturation factor RimM [Candidatus Erwinia haradaeae]|uniref:Ribosome maturation factor RimM n=1 Tax=Candidatus Erwinia haradaeae TaxID=1922217 RepID=A0A803GCC7_9GAMM|nr:ribosome maturation factor RimM [Candidatus Erwinia haradaeae]VFP87077.1 Ribosome maturation factor RimM [Candidatus Erwinia haradaeae]